MAAGEATAAQIKGDDAASYVSLRAKPASNLRVKTTHL